MILRILAYCALLVPITFTGLAITGRWFRPMDSFSHFFHYYCLAFAGIAILAVLLKLKGPAVTAVVSLICTILLLGPAKPFAFAMAKPENGVESGALKILTFNLLFANDQIDQVTEYVKRQNPDIVLLQEVSPINGKVVELLEGYRFQQRCRVSPVMETVVLSKMEPTAQGCLPNAEVPWMDLSLNGKTFRTLSVHLNWPWPFRQWHNIDDLRNDLAALPEKHPVILGGDFNAVPWSHAVRTVEDITGSTIVPGFRVTLYGYDTPFKVPLLVPIDQILLPDGAVAQSAIVGPELGSDHRPVSVTFTLAD
ncbi:MAG: endonuclease/exonuclease/phosphatase family protein [Alphaproteobacteria bacterium]